MRITRISAFRVDLPLHEGSYRWSGGKSVDVFDSTIVRCRDRCRASSVTGRCARSGRPTCRRSPPARGPGSGRSLRTLLGADPRELDALNRRMDARVERAPLRQVRRSTSRAGTCSGKVGRHAGLHAARRALRGRFRTCTGPSRRQEPEAMAKPTSQSYREEGYRQLPAQVSAATPTPTSQRIFAQ